MKNVFFKLHTRYSMIHITPSIMYERITETRQSIGIVWWRWEIYMAWGAW